MRPLPKIFRLTKKGKLIEGVFEGATINTPSMLCVEDALDGLKWAEGIGGLKALIARTSANFEAVAGWAEATPWIDFLASRPETRSPTSICLKLVETDADPKALASLLEAEGVAFDIGAYRNAPAGLRIWGGATVETSDIEALLPWLTWAHDKVRMEG
jgi:phosphoserine aminotransferase